MKSLFSTIAVAVFSTAVSFFLFKTYFPPQTVLVEQEQEQAAQLVNRINTKPRAWSSSMGPADFVEVSKRVTPAVVNIGNINANGIKVGNGSGVIISSDGYIISNYHVVEGGAAFEITLFNKRDYEARLIGTDPTTDLALLKIDAEDLETLTFGNSDNVDVGEWVLAVGNPFNLTSTVTAGIVSAKARNISIIGERYSIESFIQTDAVVNPGNSGGALVNAEGDLIGINTAILSTSRSGGYDGYSFAVPSNLVRKVIGDLREFGAVQRAILGVSIYDVDDEIAEKLELPDVKGILITSISEGSSAYKAGLKEGDVIVSVNGVQTNSVPELQEQIALFRPGDQVSLEYFREGKKYEKEDVILQGLDPNER